MHLIPNMRLIMKAKIDHIQEIVPKLRMGNFKYFHFALSGCSLMYTFLVFQLLMQHALYFKYKVCSFIVIYHLVLHLHQLQSAIAKQLTDPLFCIHTQCLLQFYRNIVGCAHIHADVNECLIDNGGCHHNCHDSDGNYTCSCNDDYQLNHDGQTCQGTLAKIHTSIFFQTVKLYTVSNKSLRKDALL